jgi:hypothetical protein
MSLFRRDPDSHLGDELRRARPKPREEFARVLAARIERQIPARMGLRLRIGVAVALTVALAGFAASFGGVGAATAAASHAVKAVQQTFTFTKTSEPKPAIPTPRGNDRHDGTDSQSNGDSRPSNGGNSSNGGGTTSNGNQGGNGQGEDDNPGHRQYHKVLMCHEGHTISVGADAVPAHLAHGDKLGACTGKDRK